MERGNNDFVDALSILSNETNQSFDGCEDELALIPNSLLSPKALSVKSMSTLPSVSPSESTQNGDVQIMDEQLLSFFMYSFTIQTYI